MQKGATVLVIDGGGRGAVLVDKYCQSEYVSRVLAIPGNDLIQESTKQIKVFPKIKTVDIEDILKIAKKEKADLVDVAQDDAVAAGVTDALLKEGIRVFGPTQTAGQIEWDKAWARSFMKDFKIPSPKFKVSKSQKEGINFIKTQKEKEWFIKASGLAAGKGALYAQNNQEAIESIRQMLSFGKSGETFLIEECLHGEEFSSFAIVDGENFVIVGHAQDHKPVFNGNLGPNTGGMGCSSPPMAVTKSIEKQISSIFQKATAGLNQLGRPYRGILYLGGIIVEGGKPAHRSSAMQSEGRVFVIEFNARWGDPEAQVIVPSIKNDFYGLARDVIDGKIQKIKIKKDSLYRIVTTAASRGYPLKYSEVTGKQIFGLGKIKKYKNVRLFGAGVKKSDGKYLAAGGRLFYVVGEGNNVAQARKIAYDALSLAYVEGNNLHYRTDIGYRDLERYYQKSSNQ